MAERTRIQPKGGWARQLLPVYSADQLIFVVASAGLAFALASLLAPDHAVAATAGAVGGSLGSLHQGRPAYLLIEGNRVPAVVEALRSNGFRYISGLDRWDFGTPRWLNWNCDFVRIDKVENGARVCGPIDTLRQLDKLI
jgi:hypothetical protein